MRILAGLLSVALAASTARAASPGSKADDDAALRAVTDEVQRYSTMKVGTFDPPYYISASVGDESAFEVTASFGAIVSKSDDTHQQIGVTVRVGTPALDNTGLMDRESFFADLFSHGSSAGTPVEADYDALRQALWLRLDSAYKSAVEQLAKKRGFLETNAVKDRPPDFGPAPVRSVMQPRQRLSVNREKWIKLVKRLSAVFRTDSHVQSATVTFRCSVQNVAVATSDPVRERWAELHSQITIIANTQSPSGMELHTRYEARGFTETDLPGEAELMKAAHDVSARLLAKTQAPQLPEDYSGPVLFTGKAASRFFLEALAEPLSRPRESLGEGHQGRLIERLGKHISSPLLSVRDDSTLKTWNGHPLWGYFPVDDDGVVPSPLTLVEKGVLKTYYMSRVPTERIAQTNGHARDGAGQEGSVFVDASEHLSRAALKKMLIKLAQENDQDYGILVDELTDPYESRYGGGTDGGGVQLPGTRVAYRVFPDGREELVVGAQFKPASYRVLKDIVGMGDQPALLNTTRRGQSVSVVAPAVLVRELELKKPKSDAEKLPVTPRPIVAAEKP